MLAALALAAALAGASPVHYDVSDLPGVQAAVDDTRALTIADARSGRIAFQPYATFRFPGKASSVRPLTLWFKIPAPALAPSQGPWFLEGRRYLGSATLYEPDGRAVDFGMRMPFNDRGVKRTWPTAPLDASQSRQTLYLRAQLDLEYAPLAIVNQAAIAQEDADALPGEQLMWLITGVFLALGLCNLLVFASIREAPYLYYSLAMFVLAALGPMSSNALAWQILWPWASMPDTWPRYTALFLEGYVSFAFAYAFLKPWEYAPRIAAACKILFWVFPAIDLIVVYGFPSVPLSAQMTMSDLQGVEETLIFAFTAVLGVVALRAGRREGSFIVAGYGVVAFAHGAFTFSSIFLNAIALRWTYLLQLGGRALEGFVLFWGLVDRLRQTMLARSVAEQRASTDALTGIANRRTFDTIVEREAMRARRGGTWLAVAMIDVDHFKRYNDTKGHRAGDDCLRRVAATVAATLQRPDDLAARYGGEEFVVVLPATDCDGAVTIAQHICEAMRDRQDVTVSIGVAAMQGEDVDPARIVECADRALYLAKTRGRDRVVAYEAYDDESRRLARA